MICGLCKGLQNLFVAQARRRAWYPCPHCKGNGDPEPIEPATINISKKQQKYMKPLKENNNG